MKENRNADQWSEIESSDMYQTEYFSGGFDGTENAFCFSFYDKNHEEYRFQVTLGEIRKIIGGQITYIVARKV